LRALHDASASISGWGGKVRLSRQVLRDLRWWVDLATTATERLIKRAPTTRTLHTDASTTGWGGVLDSDAEVLGFWGRTHPSGDMSILELRAITEVVCSFTQELRDQDVTLYCDNLAMVLAIRKMTSPTARIMVELRRLHGILGAANIRLHSRHVRSATNCWADELSRRENSEDWALSAGSFREVNARWGPLTIERFAMADRAHLRRFDGVRRTPGAESTDAFERNWMEENNLIVPPWDCLPRVAQKLVSQRSDAVVVGPFWPGTDWFQQLAGIASEMWKYPAGTLVSGRHDSRLETRYESPVVVFRTRRTCRN